MAGAAQHRHIIHDTCSAFTPLRLLSVSALLHFQKNSSTSLLQHKASLNR